MAAINRKYLALENGKRVVRESQNDDVIFTLVRIGGASGKDISLVGGHFDFNGAKLTNLADATAATEAATKGQMDTALAGKANTSHTHAISDVTGLQTALDNKVDDSEKGANNGVATLDAGGKVPVSQLPSSVMQYVGVWNANTNDLSLADGEYASVVYDGVTFTADRAGAAGNDIDLVFNGSDTVGTVVGAWNVANPGNTVSYGGLGSYVPTAGTASLTGGSDSSNGVDGIGDVYRVSVAGTQNLGHGNITFGVGDYVILSYNQIWEKSDSTDAVVSVNGQTGIVDLDTDDVDEGVTNKYYATSLFNTDFATKDTDDLAEGTTNKYYATSLFNTDFASKDTDDLAEGATNKYYSETKFNDSHAKSYTNDNAGSITVRQLVYVKANGNVDLANAAVASLDDFAVGVVKDASIATTAAGMIFVRPGAVVSGFSGLTPGKKVYLHNATAGSYTQDPTTISAGNWLYSVGRALSATELLFMPTQDPVQV